MGQRIPGASSLCSLWSHHTGPPLPGQQVELELDLTLDAHGGALQVSRAHRVLCVGPVWVPKTEACPLEVTDI